MKKTLVLLFVVAFALPVFASADISSKMQQEEQKYQLKVEKIRKKQELKCLKNPDKCSSTNVKNTNLTLGAVQQSVSIGTSQDEVALALGSPNIITVDSDGKDTWIYDKISTVTSYSNSGLQIGAGGIGGGIGVGGSSLGGGGGRLGVGYGSSKGNVQTNNRTLTVVIKFDKTHKVESFNYHMSSF